MRSLNLTKINKYIFVFIYLKYVLYSDIIISQILRLKGKFKTIFKSNDFKRYFFSVPRDPAVKDGPLLLGVRGPTADKGNKSVQKGRQRFIAIHCTRPLRQRSACMVCTLVFVSLYCASVLPVVTAGVLLALYSELVNPPLA